MVIHGYTFSVKNEFSEKGKFHKKRFSVKNLFSVKVEFHKKQFSMKNTFLVTHSNKHEKKHELKFSVLLGGLLTIQESPWHTPIVAAFIGMIFKE